MINDNEKIVLSRKEYQDILEFVDKMEQFAHFQDRIDLPTNIRQIWKTFLDDLRNVIQIETCALFMVEEDTNEFVLKCISPSGEKKICKKEIESQIESGMFFPIINRRQPAVTPALKFPDRESIIMLPLVTVRKTIGVVVILSSVDESSMTRENLQLLNILGKQCSIVIENTILYEHLKTEHESLKKANEEIKILSRHDPLTGCFNRGYLAERLPQEIKRTLRYGTYLSLIITDIDHFKKVNDRYGHQAGDLVLIEFVRLTEEMIRSNIDGMFRYGGEEFIIMLPETNIKGAVQLAERLRIAVSETFVDIQKNHIKFTASYGVTGIVTGALSQEPSSDMMIGSADKYLYKAKLEGRNMVKSGSLTVD